MEGKCIVSGCGKAASKCCGSCGLVKYCSVECQKEDWKKCHKKLECVNMKILASVPLTGNEINDVANRISSISRRLKVIGEAKRSIDVWKECINVVRDRIGRLDLDNSRRLMRDGVSRNHLLISRLLVNLGRNYFNMQSSSDADGDSHCMSYTSEARELLVQMRDVGINDPEMWLQLLDCDNIFYNLYARRDQFEDAKHHSVEAVATARRYNGPDQVDHLIAALGLLVDCLRGLSSFTEALAVAEEAYTVASRHYSPVHKTVIEAGGQMIDCLIAMKDYSTADTYARMSYANVIDPMNAKDYDPETRFFMMHQLVEIWLMKEPDDDEIVEKALADEAIDLARKVHADAVENHGQKFKLDFLHTFCDVLVKANKLTEETEGLLRRLVRICIAENNLDGKDIQTSLGLLARFYRQLNDSFPVGKKSKLVQENASLCWMKVCELKSYSRYVGYVQGSREIKPYFKKNVGLRI